IELALPPDEGRVETPLEGQCVRINAQEPPRAHRFGLSLYRQRPERLELGRPSHQIARRRADNDGASVGRFFQPFGDVYSIARDERAAAVTRDDFAGVDPDADGEA